ncbi:MAG TPA: tetratricopeptide repeat protein [Vicinamibacterales bacterium]|nr:tetratricopeptide repeat protein [Vicinamibacterales bacterium]
MSDAHIDNLRRRVDQDPASIAFAQLAEELRRAGRYQEAVDTCRAGLRIHPDYLSARVTLGRALLELDRLDEARDELEQVANQVPQNQPARRGLAEIDRRRGASDATMLSVAQPPADEGAEGRLLRTVTALEQWIEAIHVARTHAGA